MIKAVIFDMDGTMVNTENLWRDINIRLAEKYNAIMDDTVRVRMMGRKDYDSLSIFKEYNNLQVSVEELIATRRKMLLEDLSMVKVNDGLYQLLDLLDSLAIKKAVATSSFTEFTKKVLDMFNLSERFSIVVTGDDITISKPDPSIFLEAARRLKIVPTDCVVIEDAQNGVEAGYNAKMKIIAIPHMHSKHHDFSKATKVLDSMLDIDENMLRSL